MTKDELLTYLEPFPADVEIRLVLGNHKRASTASAGHVTWEHRGPDGQSVLNIYPSSNWRDWVFGDDQSPYPGDPLRDYFAGQAIAGLLSGDVISIENGIGVNEVRTAYAVADAMLKERDISDE